MPYTIDTSSLLKLLLHAAKYPASAINGLLLGTVGAASSDSAVQITDVVPLFHSFLHLAMPLETALLQVSAYAESKGQQIVGLYHANESLSDRELGPGPRKIADKLHQQCCARACVLLVDNVRLGKFLSGQDTGFLQLYTRPDGGRGWSLAASIGNAELRHAPGDIPQLYVDYVGEGRHRRLADFDEHLDDLSRDWTNKDLVA